MIHEVQVWSISCQEYILRILALHIALCIIITLGRLRVQQITSGADGNGRVKALLYIIDLLLDIGWTNVKAALT